MNKHQTRTKNIKNLKLQNIEVTEKRIQNVRMSVEMIYCDSYKNILRKLFQNLNQSIQINQSDKFMMDIIIFYQSHGIKF